MSCGYPPEPGRPDPLGCPARGVFSYQDHLRGRLQLRSAAEWIARLRGEIENLKQLCGRLGVTGAMKRTYSSGITLSPAS